MCQKNLKYIHIIRLNNHFDALSIDSGFASTYGRGIYADKIYMVQIMLVIYVDNGY